jgi:hypothetical protein
MYGRYTNKNKSISNEELIALLHISVVQTAISNSECERIVIL